MEFDVRIELTAIEILSWFSLFMIAWNPGGAFTGFFEHVGVKLPFFMAASGAGSKIGKFGFDKFKGGINQ